MRKIIIRVFNILFIAAAAISITGFLTKPLVSLDVEVSIPATQIASMIGGGETEDTPQEEAHIVKSFVLSEDEKPDGEGEKPEGEGEKPGEQSKSEDFDLLSILSPENLEKENVSNLDLKLDITITPASYTEYLDLANNYQMLYRAIQNFLTTFIDTAYEYFNELMNVVAKIVAKDVITQQVKDQIKAQLERSGAEGDADNIFATSGCEEKVDQLVDKVMDEFTEGNCPLTELANTITEDEDCGVKGILEDLKENNVPGFEEVDISNVKSEDIQSAMNDALSSVPGLTEERPVLDENGDPVKDADGNVVTETYVTDIPSALMALLDMLNGTGNSDSQKEEQQPEQNIEEGEKDDEQQKEVVEKHTLKSFFDDAEPEPTPEPTPELTPEEKAQQLKKKVEDFILGLIPFDINNIDYSAGGIMSYVLVGLILLGIFPWALFALVTLIRTLRKRKCWTKTWIVFVLAFTQLIFGIALTLVFKFGTPAIMSVAGSAIPQEYAGLLGGLTVNFSTAALWGSIVYLAMIPVTIVYKIICHKTKKEFKEYKRNGKKAA